MRELICIIMALLLSNLPHIAAAELASSEMIPTAVAIEELNRTRNRHQIEDFLSRADVRLKLSELGLSHDQITQRLATLSDSEIQKLAGEIKQARFGGDVTGLLVVVVLVLLIIFLAKRI